MIDSSSQRSSDQNDRVAALHRYDILDTGPEEQFDRLADLAAHVFNVPTALISFIKDDSEWMKARRNFDRQVLPLEVSFGTHTIENSDLLVIEDTRDDVRFVENPLVSGPSGIRFYAGAPLLTPAGYRIGTIAVMDTEPQSPDPDALDQLHTLASLVMEELEGRLDPEDQRDELDLLLDPAQGNSVILDRNGVILRTNESWRDFARANELDDESRVEAGVNYLEVSTLPSDDPDHHFGRQAREGIRAVIQGEKGAFDMVYPCHAPAQKRWFHMQVMALDHPRGRALVSHVDVTDLKQQQRRRQFLETAVEQAKEVVLITGSTLDEPGPRITYVNPAFTEVTGYEPEEVIGKTPRLLQGPATEPWILDDLRQSLERGEPSEGEAINYRKDGTPYVNHWSIAPIPDDDGQITHWVSVQRDVTEQRKMSVQLLRAQEKERHRIGKEIHDEIGGLLTSLQLFLSLVRAEAEEDLPPSAPFADLEETVTELSNVVRILTDQLYSRVLSDHGFTEALRHLADRLEEQESIEVELHDETSTTERLPPLVKNVAFRGVRQALSNVAEHAQTDRTQVIVNREARMLRVHVVDQGVGFDPADVDMEANEYGLASTRESVECLNGMLDVHSAPGEGTRITMTLPTTLVPLLDG